MVILAILLTVGGLLITLAWRGSENAMHPAPGLTAWELGNFPSLKPVAITFKSKTRATIAGRFFAGRTRATIVLVHGYAGSQDEMLPVANFLHDAGFSVFSYDSRGCGSSGGEVTFGALEQGDLISAVDYLASRSDVDEQRIGAFGFSMGAATTILAAARDGRIKAVVDDSGWADVHHWLRPNLRTLLLHPIAPFSTLSLRLVELRSGIDLSRLRPEDNIDHIAPRPILIIHGTADEVVPPQDSELNFAAAGHPKGIWWVQGAAHGETMGLSGTAYRDRVSGFFLNALAA